MMSKVKKIDRTNICKQFNADGICSIAEKPCWYEANRSVCAFNAHYIYLTETGGPPITTEIKKRMLPKVVKRWKESGGTGARSMAARPLEDETSDMIKEKLGHLNIEVITRKRFTIAPGVNTIADVRLEKPDYPTSIISMKTYIGPGEFRNCLADAYLTKLMYGMLQMRFYLITLEPQKITDQLLQLGKPHIDGHYHLSGVPYADDLFSELEELYGGKVNPQMP